MPSIDYFVLLAIIIASRAPALEQALALLTFLLLAGAGASIPLLSFILALVLGFGVIFELPIVLYVLGRIGIISSGWMWRTRPYWIIGLGVVANLLMPGSDPFTPLLMMVPLYIFYEGTALLLRLTGR